MKKIVPHKGPAHVDDFLSCCCLLAAYPGLIIVRRECTEADLNDPEVAVVDQGGRDQPALLNFDHHQDEPDAPPRCALTLVLKYLGQEDTAREHWPWFSTVEYLDSKGPHKLAKHVGIPWDKIVPLLSHIDNTLLKMFARRTIVSEDDHLYLTMTEMGQLLLGELQGFGKRLALLNKEARIAYVDGLAVLDARCTGREDPLLLLEEWCKDCHPEVAVTVTLDNRGPGLALFRRNDHPRIDFFRLERREDVLYADKRGFIAKTRSADADCMAMIKAAMVEG